MTQKELLGLIEEIQHLGVETNNIEFKAGGQGFPSIYDTLSSFSNQDSGGVIILGFDEVTNSVCGVSDAADFVRRIEDACAAMQPRLQVTVTSAIYEGRSVISIEVPGLPKHQRPCFKFSDGMTNGSYVRVGNGDIKMPTATLHEYLTYSSRIYADVQPVRNSRIADIMTPSFQKYKIAAAERKSLFAMQSDEKLLENSGFTVDGVPTLAGLMILSDYPQKYFRNFYISAAVFDQNSETARVLDGEHIDGNISSMLESALRFVKRNIRHPIYFDGDKRIDVPQYPDIALRELLLNALLHRDYDRFSEGRCINLMIHPDKVVIASPGLLYGSMTIESLSLAGYAREIRNPSLVSGVELLMNTENKGTGIRVSRQAMLDMHLKEPLFVQDTKTNTFLVTLKSKIGRASINGDDTTYFG